jgi:hypothetical protein
VRWKKLSFADLVARIRDRVPRVPEDAARPIATLLFMCLPLPDAWCC